jgi:hypothetical protein
MRDPIHSWSPPAIRFQVPAGMIKEIVERREQKNMEDLAVRFTAENLVLTGKLVKNPLKIPVKIPFEIALRPVFSSGRKMYFSVDQFSPLNTEWLKRAVLRRPPWLNYLSPYLEINLEPALLNDIPFGQIRFIRIENQSLIVGVGI